MKTYIFLLCFLWFACANQVFLYGTDTLRIYHIEEVSVSRHRGVFYSDDKKIIDIDSMIMSLYRNSDMGQLLSASVPVNIRQYGAEGSITMVTVRGLRANHTQVNWNGIPINSMTTGDNDLSMIPSGFMDEVSLNFGAPGSLYGSGTFGAAIDMNNDPDWNNKLRLNLSYQKGTLQSNYFRIGFKTGNRKVQYHLGVQHNRAGNEFTSPLSEIRIRNNSFKSTGIIQNVFISLPKDFDIQAGIWLQFKEKELPGYTNPRFPSYGRQNDSTLKTYVLWSKRFDHSKWSFTSAYITDYLYYRYKPDMNMEYFPVNATYDTKRFYNELSCKYYLSSAFTLDYGGSWQYAYADVSNYDDWVVEKRYSFFAAAKYRLKKMVLNASLREEMVDRRRARLLYSAGWQYSVTEHFLVSGNLSNKYRTPTFNERYWRPGGNPDLLPETGWSSEISFKNMQNKGNHHWTVYHTFFYSKVDNMIQWVSGADLHPVPEKEVVSSGYELNTGYSYRIKMFLLDADIKYIYSKSVITDHISNENLIGNDLIYAPVHSLTGSVFVHRSFFYAGFCSSYTGNQYTTENNDRSNRIKPYSVTSLYFGADLKFFGTSQSLMFTVKNLFDTGYEAVKSYPMPGRTFYLSFSTGLNK